MEIIKWDEWNPGKYKDFEKSNEREQAVNVLINCMRENQYRFNGYYHQNGGHGAPVFDNGKQLQFSLRGWGEIMSKAYPDEIDDSDGFGYCAWAWSNGDEGLLKYLG